ncbi:MAG: MFS transporter [Hyphomonas sp.]|nr:MFS transporter [Hyphomonas sp.]MBU3919214.1 MFS transporter [Alphaproteobacteria bacterium]MBU4061827.1 MFS transporter [Alphaproteobacteria bacterium]MBU4163341.1 MFS transporter [Alphaproteobacteria bacterium]
MHPFGRSGALSSVTGGLTAYRNVLALVAALTLLQGALAALAFVMSLKLLASGVSSAGIGLVASAYSAGFLSGTLIAPLEIGRIGHIRAFTILGGLCALVALVLPLAGSTLTGWALLLAIAGLGAAGTLTAGESWIANAAPAQKRGAILGFYHMVSKTGAMVAPFVVATAPNGLGAYMIVAALFVASLIPVAATNRSQPELVAAKPFRPMRIVKLAPASAFAAFCAGAVNNSIAQLYPIFATSVSHDDVAGFSAQLNGAILAGAMLGLWPIGLLSDRFDRRIVIAAAAAIGAAAAMGIALTSMGSAPWLILLLAGVFGAGSLSYYGVAVANAADRACAEEITSMMAGILVIWGIGSVIGPPVAGIFLMFVPGGAGLFVFAAVALTGLCVLCFSRVAVAPPVPAHEREPFSVSPATSLAIAEFDPRGDEIQPDLFFSQTPNIQQEPA